MAQGVARRVPAVLDRVGPPRHAMGRRPPAGGTDRNALDGEEPRVADGAHAHSALLDRRQITLAVAGALGQRSPGLARHQELAFDFNAHRRILSGCLF